MAQYYKLQRDFGRCLKSLCWVHWTSYHLFEYTSDHDYRSLERLKMRHFEIAIKFLFCNYFWNYIQNGRKHLIYLFTGQCSHFHN